MGNLIPDEINFVDERLNIIWNQRFLICVGVEVAIGATMFTEGDVDVNGRCHGVRYQGSGAEFWDGAGESDEEDYGSREQNPQGGADAEMICGETDAEGDEFAE